jgi:O-antigen/teichoic acid export membrane protein
MAFDAKQKIEKITAYLQKLTGTDIKYLFTGSFWLAIGQFFSSLAGLITAYLFANFLPKETYGTYAYCVSLIGIFSLFALQGINGALTQAVAKGKDGILLPVLRVRIKWALIGAGAAALFAAYNIYQGKTELGLAIFVIAFFIPIFDPLNSYAGFINGKKEYRTLAFYNATTRLMPMVFIALAVYFSDNLLVVLGTYLLAHTLTRLVLFIRTYRIYKPKEENDPQSISFGKHLSLINALGLLSAELDKVLIFNFLGPAQLATYSFALIPVSQLKRPTGILDSLTLPKMAGRTMSELQKSIPRKMVVYFICVLAMTAGYIIFAPFGYKIFFPQYMEAVPYSRILAISLLALPVSLVTQALVSQSAQKQLYVSKLGLPMIRIVLLLILLPTMKIWGVILTTILSEIAGLILTFFVFKKAKNEQTNANN